MTQVAATPKAAIAEQKPTDAEPQVGQAWRACVALFWKYTEASEKADRSSYDGLL